MKNKTLAITATAILTAAAIVLTVGLSLFNTSAIGEILENSGILNQEPNVDTDVVPEVMPELEPEIIPDDVPLPDNTPEPDAEAEEAIEPNVDISVVPEVMPQLDAQPQYEYPHYGYTVGDARDVYVGGGEDVNKGVVIDVYSHKTGKLVGQLAFTSQEICSYISNLVREDFEPANELWIDREAKICQPLPQGEYRIEVYAGTWFSYTYGKGEIFELTQCTLTFTGGEKITGYIDMLIADLIADIEAGNVEAPAPEMAVSKLIYRGLEGYWEGYFVEELGYSIPGAGRFCERFPYIEVQE